jgi:DNA-binding transcriptional MocR family regulator
MIQRAAARALDRFGHRALQYGNVAGPGPLLEWLTARIGHQEGRAPEPDELLITGGISAGLDLLLTTHTQPGDTVLVESPTYHLAVRILQDHRLNLVAVPVDGQGLDVENLARVVSDLQRDGAPPRALYTVPTFNNPTGVCLISQRRRGLLELAAEQQILVIEDDVYRELGYDAPSPPPLWSEDRHGSVVRLGSFSKSLAPGLRLGWMTARAEVVGRLVQSGVLDSSGGVNHFTAVAVFQVCESGDYDAHVRRLRQAYRVRRDALLLGLRDRLPEGCEFEAPGGGYFVWLRLPSGLDGEALLSHAEASGTSYIPGARFHLGPFERERIRLAFSLHSPARLEEAAERLGEAIRSFQRGSSPQPPAGG